MPLAGTHLNANLDRVERREYLLSPIAGGL
jgi:hypothetical protein